LQHLTTVTQITQLQQYSLTAFNKISQSKYTSFDISQSKINVLLHNVVLCQFYSSVIKIIMSILTQQTAATVALTFKHKNHRSPGTSQK